jgi:AcrR family transcriptional regulator
MQNNSVPDDRESREAGTPDSTPERILAAARQVYAEAGFRGTTTRRVAQVAGVNEITLFRHFGNKETLIKKALNAHYENAGPRPLGEPVDPPAQLQDWALGTFEHWYAARHLIVKILSDLGEHPELAPAIVEPGSEHLILAGYFTRMRELGLTTREFHPDAATGLLLGGLFSHAVWRDYTVLPDQPLPPAADVVRLFVNLVLGSIGFRPTRTGTSKE